VYGAFIFVRFKQNNISITRYSLLWD